MLLRRQAADITCDLPVVQRKFVDQRRIFLVMSGAVGYTAKLLLYLTQCVNFIQKLSSRPIPPQQVGNSYDVE